MECYACGEEIVPGQARVPSRRGTVHAECTDRAAAVTVETPTAESVDDESEADISVRVLQSINLKRGLLSAAVAALGYLTVRHLWRRDRR